MSEKTRWTNGNSIFLKKKQHKYLVIRRKKTFIKQMKERKPKQCARHKSWMHEWTMSMNKKSRKHTENLVTKMKWKSIMTNEIFKELIKFFD